MFHTEKIAAFLQGVKFTGDKDKKNLELTIYITPISYDLAAEVSEGIADRLFREGSDGSWNPALEMPSARFEGPKIPVQTVTVYPVADGAMPAKELEKSRTTLINVNIDSFSSLRLIAEKPDLTLAFKAHVDMDKVSVELAMRYFKTKVYLTFAAMQAELPMDHPNTVESNALCEECDLVATVIDQDGHTYCSKHVRAAVGEIRELHPERRETPQQAEQRVLREALAGSTPLGADEPGAPIGEPGGPPAVEEADLGDAAYINEKASKVKKRQRQAVN